MLSSFTVIIFAMFESSKSGWLIKFTEELEEVEEEAVVEFDATIVEAEAAIVEWFWYHEEILTERISLLKQDLRLKQRLNNRKYCRRERIKRERIWEKKLLYWKILFLA